MTSTLEELFAFQATAAGLPAFEREVCAIPGRKFRFDFCWRTARLLVEINGGTYTKAARTEGGWASIATMKRITWRKSGDGAY